VDGIVDTMEGSKITVSLYLTVDTGIFFNDAQFVDPDILANIGIIQWD
jgi:hypothetical protein